MMCPCARTFSHAYDAHYRQNCGTQNTHDGHKIFGRAAIWRLHTLLLKYRTPALFGKLENQKEQPTERLGWEEEIKGILQCSAKLKQANTTSLCGHVCGSVWRTGISFSGQRFGGPLICTWRMHYASWTRTMACFSGITGRNRWVWCLYVKSEGNEKEDESVDSRLYSLSAKANRTLTWAIIGLCI